MKHLITAFALIGLAASTRAADNLESQMVENSRRFDGLKQEGGAVSGQSPVTASPVLPAGPASLVRPRHDRKAEARIPAPRKHCGKSNRNFNATLGGLLGFFLGCEGFAWPMMFLGLVEGMGIAFPLAWVACSVAGLLIGARIGHLIDIRKGKKTT